MNELTSQIDPSEKPKPINHDIGGGRGVFISTYGCQMNVNDSERMYSILEMSNFMPVDSADKAELIIINSCSVREKPVHKVYSEVGTYRDLKKKNPGLIIGVGGCVGQQEKDKLIKKQPLIDFVFGTDAIDELPQTLKTLLGRQSAKEKVVNAQFHHKEPYHVDTLVRNPGVSTFVNITKGCDNFCTFCVVPFTRGREKSRPLKHIMTDIHALVKRGVKEVTLLGQNVNSYKSDCGVDFADLLSIVSTEGGLERLRFTTSHPKDYNQKLMEVLAKHQNKLGEYIHLPFQSGNTRILEKMNRGYTREEYLEKIRQIKSIIPNAVFSSDIIVGFPSETEAEFMDTMTMVEEVAFETIFAFKYSPRPFTKAEKMDGHLDEATKSERLNRLFDMHNKLSFEWVKKYEGRTLQILVEKVEGENRLSGRSSQNKLTYFDGPANLVGQVLPVKVTKALPNVFRGEIEQ